jgi:hypothetical protein
MGYCGTWGGETFLVVTVGGGEGIIGGMDVCVCVCVCWPPVTRG